MPGRQNQYVTSAGSGTAVRKHSEDVVRGWREGRLCKEGLKRSRRAFLFSGGHRILQKINSLGYWITVEWILSVTCKILRAEMIKEQLKHRHS